MSPPNPGSRSARHVCRGLRAALDLGGAKRFSPEITEDPRHLQLAEAQPGLAQKVLATSSVGRETRAAIEATAQADDDPARVLLTTIPACRELELLRPLWDSSI
jgi:hypothetical protein